MRTCIYCVLVLFLLCIFVLSILLCNSGVLLLSLCILIVMCVLCCIICIHRANWLSLSTLTGLSVLFPQL